MYSFKIKELTYLFCCVISPLALGGLIYLTSRGESIYLVRWFGSIDLLELPDWVVYNVPDGLFAFSFMSTLKIIWSNDLIVKKWELTFILLLISSELFQLWFIPGTFDFKDIIAILVGITFFYIIKKELMKSVLSIVTIFVFSLFFIASSEETGTSEETGINIKGQFLNDNLLKDYLVSEGELDFSCRRYGFSAKIKFLNHDKVEVSVVGQGGWDKKWVTGYTIEERRFWEALGTDKEFRRAVILDDGGVFGDDAVVQFMCFSVDPHASKPSFKGQRVRLEDGCSGLSL